MKHGPKIKTVYLFINGKVGVMDATGAVVPGFDGDWKNIRKAVLSACDDDTEFYAMTAETSQPRRISQTELSS